MPSHPRLQQVIRNAPLQMGCGLVVESSIAVECLPTLECGTVEMRDSMGHEGKGREEIGLEKPFQRVIDGVITNGEYHVEKSGEDEGPPQYK